MTDEAEHVELLWPMVPIGDVDGALDWISGVMQLDVLPEHFRNPADAPREIQVPMMRTWAHETFHYLQCSSLGFMYDWVAELATQIRSIIKRSDLLPLDFTKFKRLIKDGPALLQDAEHQALEAHFAQLDEPSSSGLTARAIFESHAYFVERRALHPIKIASDWTPHLVAVPAPIYRVAFDALAYVAGHQVAFDWFPATAAVALCCERPAAAFDRLAFALARTDTENLIAPRARFEFLQRSVGTKLRTPIEGTDKVHTLFTEAAQRLAAAAHGGFPIHDLFVQPYLHLNTLADEHDLMPPIIFKPMPEHQLAIRAPDGADRSAILALFAFGAAGKRLLQNVEAASQSRSEAVIQRLSWLVRDPALALFDLAAEDLRSGDPSRMVQLFEPGPESATWWGRLALRLPEELDPTQETKLPDSPEARRLFAALHARLPSFPVYLAPQFGFFDWFGSLAPEDARGPEGLNFADERVIELASIAAASIEASGRALGLNPWLALRCLLQPYFALPEP